MVQNNKVLTVSYGTFSCTLEGFEDSFGTMKAIAEYFRDLAADDRYFGAEPPQPDADMLARIAQREIARQVEARTSDSGIHLRAAEVAAVAAPAAAPAPAAATEAVEPPAETPAPAEAAAPVAEPVAAPVAEPIEEIAEEAKAEPVAEAEVVPPAAPRPGADSIAAKLQRIRAVVSKVPAPEEEEFSEDQHADTEVDEAIAEISAALAEDDQVEEAVDDDGGEADDQAEIARVLSRIDAGEAAAEEVAAAPVAEPDEDLAEPVAETPAETAEDSTTDDSDLMAAVSRSMADPAPAAEAAAVEAETAKADTPEPAPAEEPRQRTRIVRIKRAHLNELRNQAAAELELRDSPDAAPKAGPKADVQPEPKPEAVAEDTPAAPPAPAPAVAETAPAPEAPETHLSEDDEADLLRELAAVEAELLGATGTEDDSEDDTTAEAVNDTAEDDGDAETAAEEAPAEVAEIAEPVRPKRPSREAATRDSDISRLMAAADEKLGDPETSSSRETYSHMRAAVAAAQAEKSAGGSLGSEDQVEAYREDLANVVKPRRPSAEGRRAQPRPTPAASRPAPLKLVAAQRIDQDTAPKPSGPVRPRRIAAVTEDDSAFDAKGSEGGFKAFAQEQGAVELHELLEAAASYMSFVEGREHFSRPQLMNKVRQVDGADFNREDGLRHFGTLLREGKIERSGNGQFTASGQIGFQPDERAAG